MSFLWHMATAGLWSLTWHWGLGIGIIILCLAGAFFSSAIPIIGTFLAPLRKDLEWVAAATAVGLFMMGVGAHDESARCVAKTTVIEKHVEDVVKGVEDTTPIDDPFDSKDN